ncbi:hypothetical protein Tco_0440012 [Tanacetum coccineum]
MTTLAEHIIVAGAENYPPMLEKSMYDSWASRIRLFIKGKKHGRMMLDSIDNALLVYLTVEENRQTRPKKYSELTKAQQLQDDCDVQATNIILHGLSPDVYALVNHQEAAKDIWDRGETLCEYYWRFSQLINDMHTIGMTMQQVQVNTKFLNVLPSKWSKFVTDVKLAKSLYTTNYDQLYAYLSQHERHANDVRSLMYPPPQQFTPVYAAPIHHQHHHTPVNPQQHLISPPPFISPLMTQQSQAEFPQLDSSLDVPMFQTSSNPRNQATIQDGGVTVQQYQSYAGIRNRGIATTSKGNVAAGPPRTLVYQKLQLLSRQSFRIQLSKLATWMHMNLDCDDLSSAKAVLMANLSSCDHEVLSEVPYSDSYLNDMINQDVQEMQYSKQTHVDDFKDNEIHSGSNIIPYSQYLQESQDAVMQDTNPSAPNDLLEIGTLKEALSNTVKEKESLSKTLSVFKIESKEKESKYIDKEIVLEKQNKELENIICKMYRSTQAMHMLTKPYIFYDDTHKQALGYQNSFHLKKAQRIQLTLYDGSVIAKEHVVISVIDDEETLILEEDSRSKMLDKKNDPISIEKKIKIFPIDYSKLNKIKEDFESKLRVNFLRYSCVKKSCVNNCNKYLELEIELFKKKDFIEKEAENSGENLNAPTFNQLFEINELKAQLQEKDTVIRKLTEKIKSLSGKDSVENVKKDIDEIETINIELEHSVAKLLSENENLRKKRDHLKSIYKDQFDSIRKTRVQSKKHCDSLIAQINAKYLENSDLNAQLQEKVFANAALKSELRKLKGKNVVDTAVSKPNATIAPGMFKLNIEPISPRLKNNKDAHEVYIDKTIEYTVSRVFSKVMAIIIPEPCISGNLFKLIGPSCWA